MQKLLTFTALSFAASTCLSAHAATYHVAPAALAGIDAKAQFRTISEAAKIVQAGDDVQIHSGTYRESVTVDASGSAQKPIRFEAFRGASVMITGADRIEKWDKVADAPDDENIFVADWPHRFITWNKLGIHPDDDEHKMIGRAEQVFINDYPLLQVLARNQVTRGTFYVDLDAKKLYVQENNNSQSIGSDPSSAPRVEASVRGNLWESKGEWIALRGVRFRYAANQAQSGAARFSGAHDSIEDCVFERTNSSGASFSAPDVRVLRCTFADNGQLGWSAAGAHRMLMSDCLTTRNNVKNFSRGWEAGGDKIVLSRDVIIEKSRFTENRGIGIWFDIGNENPIVRNCLIADNEDSGIFYEISYGLKARDNVIIGNGFAGNAGAWGANGGIALSSSPDCVIERNLLIGNKEGFQFREQGRTTPRLDAPKNSKEVWVWNHDQTIRNNVLAYNRDAQVWGWFDVHDQRMWPLAMQEKTVAANLNDKDRNFLDFAADYVAKDQTGAPKPLSLESLKINFAGNLYAPGDNGAVLNWGTAWKRNRKYLQLADLQRELGFEKNGLVAPFVFGDYLTRDFRVPANSPALKMKAYPQGEVPGVQLGVLPGK